MPTVDLSAHRPPQASYAKKVAENARAAESAAKMAKLHKQRVRALTAGAASKDTSRAGSNAGSRDQSPQRRVCGLPPLALVIINLNSPSFYFNSRVIIIPNSVLDAFVFICMLCCLFRSISFTLCFHSVPSHRPHRRPPPCRRRPLARARNPNPPIRSKWLLYWPLVSRWRNPTKAVAVSMHLSLPMGSLPL